MSRKEKKAIEHATIIKNVLDNNKQKLHELEREALRLSLELNEFNEEIKQTMKFIIDIHERGIEAIMGLPKPQPLEQEEP